VETNILSSILIAFLICAILFLLLREFFCWYYKINEIAGILRRIEAKLPSLTGVSDIKPEIEQHLTGKESPMAVSYFKKIYSSYSTEKLKKMSDRPSDDFDRSALVAVKELLKERGEQ
jgi:hypothetical protein